MPILAQPPAMVVGSDYYAQIIPAPPGLYALFDNGDGKMRSMPVVAWALQQVTQAPDERNESVVLWSQVIGLVMDARTATLIHVLDVNQLETFVRYEYLPRPV